MPTETEPAAGTLEHPQSRYQVRLHLAVDPARLASLRLSGDHLVIVDVLDDGEFTAPAVDSAAAALPAEGLPAEGRPPAARPAGGLPVAGFRTRTAAARAVLAAQAARGDRVFVDLVTPARPDGQFAVEDFLAAGAVVDALAELGIDFSSPEAAAACAAFTTLRRALAHLVTASAAGQSWSAAGRTPDVLAACALDADGALPDHRA